GKQTADEESRHEAAVSRLNLSAEQKEKIKALRQNQKQQMTELRQSLKAARLKIKEHLNNPETTRESIIPLAADVKAILAKMVDQRTDAIFAVREMLTPEQFSQLQQAKQKPRHAERDCRPFRRGNKGANKEENNQKE
ncbi:MAG: periplasmic heavy metal sensor, partial [Kiritimatiellia bacterium]|nr:periplasmic heavy metal sensor [Kiritimatiellia bacterium]